MAFKDLHRPADHSGHRDLFQSGDEEMFLPQGLT
jgi:hypothetical protein